MPARLRFSFYGDAQIDRTLDGFELRADDASPAWEVLADRFLDAERRQFASEGGYGSGGWAPLSAPYAAWKATAAPGAPILVFSGALRDKLTEGPEIRVITPSRMVVGASDEVGGYHQSGTDKMPRRRPVEFPDDERTTWGRVVHRFIVTGEAI